ncbi:MAG: DUF2993 domain-containing protein [Firmicutes bacterium]|nr:DUF2993 domain-containing protein [Bacillota bacterium]
MRRIIAAVVLIALGVTLLASIKMLPKYLAAEIEKVIREEVVVENLEISIKSHSGFPLLLGKIDEVDVKATNLIVEGLTVDKLEVEVKDLKLDIQSLFRDQELAFQDVDSITAWVALSEETINNYYHQYVDQQQAFVIDLAEDGAILNGSIKFWNVTWDVALKGRFEITGPTHMQIRFLPEELLIADTRFPQVLLEIINDQYQFAFDFSSLPVPIELNQVKTEGNTLMIFGSSPNR